MATKTVSVGSRIKLKRPASTKLVGILKKPQTAAQKNSTAQAKGTYSLYREKWIRTQ